MNQHHCWMLAVLLRWTPRNGNLRKREIKSIEWYALIIVIFFIFSVWFHLSMSKHMDNWHERCKLKIEGEHHANVRVCHSMFVSLMRAVMRCWQSFTVWVEQNVHTTTTLICHAIISNEPNDAESLLFYICAEITCAWACPLNTCWILVDGRNGAGDENISLSRIENTLNGVVICSLLTGNGEKGMQNERKK